MTDTLPASLLDYIRRRAKAQGLSVSDLCKAADISRQTLYALGPGGSKCPSNTTLLAVAQALDMHPGVLLDMAMRLAPGRHRPEPALPRVDKSAFVGDVTLPDGSVVMPGQRLEKIWAIQNAGEVTWQGRFLRCMDDELVVTHRSPGGAGDGAPVFGCLLPEARRIPLPDAAPGETVTLALTFTAPQIPGAYISYWKSEFADGTLCFPQSIGLSVRVRVVDMVLAAAEASGAWAG